MKVKSVSYMGSYAYDHDLPAAVGPEFVFVGRSNVGKSSLINSLVGRRNLARTSNAPGKTRTANFYPINDSFCFVDVPGYGYAQVSKAERARWAKLIAAYLEKREVLRGIVHLLDVRHTPSRADREVSHKLSHAGRPMCVVFNKVDKLKRRDVDRRIGEHLGALSVTPETAVVPFSAETGEGRRAVWAWIEHVLSL